MVTIKSKWMGEVCYNDALSLQENYAKETLKTKNITILGLEHNPVITLGKRGNINEDLIFKESELKDLGWEIKHIDRGGQATIHAPGQLVVYPIMDLREQFLGVKKYIECLLKITHKSFNHLGVKTAMLVKHPGLYTDKGKITFIGVRISKGVTSHGISINIKNNLSHFKNIRSCGIKSENFDSLESRGIDTTCQEFFNIWCEEFKKEFIALNNLNGNFGGEQILSI
jgi:lipoyl(octanoyl) transferase